MNIAKLQPKPDVDESAARRQFGEHVASVGFQLTLSKRQIAFFMDFAANGPRSVVAKYSHFISHVRCLEERGLLGRRTIIEEEGGWRYEWFLTEPGKLVVKLLQLAGHKAPKKEKRSGSAI